MEETVPLPQINKIPFIVFDVLLVLTALVVGLGQGGPLPPMMFFLVIFCVALGGVVACLPFYAEFRTLAKLKEYDLSQANHENARRIEAALLGIQEIGENIVQHTDREADIAAKIESLLERMESRIAEIQSAPAPAGMDPEQLNKALAEQLDAVKDDFSRAIVEQAALAGDKQHDKLNAALSKLQGLPMQVTLLGELASRYETVASMLNDTAASLIATPPASAAAELLDTGGVAEGIEGEEGESDLALDSGVPARPQAPDEEPHQPESSETAPDEEPHQPESSETGPEVIDEGINDSGEDSVVLPSVDEELEIADSDPEMEDSDGMGFDDWDDFGEIAAADTEVESKPIEVETAVEQPDLMEDIPPSQPKSKPHKSRGATTLIAQVLIGIGNKPYVRGTGPGLSEEEGVPMEFLEIGKWQWVAPESDEPVTVHIYKNDEVPAEGEPVEIPAGHRRSVAPKFPS